MELWLTLWGAVSSLAFLWTETRWESVNDIAAITLEARAGEKDGGW